MIKAPAGYGVYLKELVAYHYNKKAQLELNGCGDLPDPRDHNAPMLAGYNVHIPDEWNVITKAKELGYELPVQSLNSCTAYARIIHADVVNTIWNQRLVKLDAERQWSYQEETGASRDSGDLIQNAYGQYHKHPQGYPDLEYQRMRFKGDEAIRQIKLHLIKFNLVGTGVYWRNNSGKTESNYTQMLRTGWYEPMSGLPIGGHAVVIIGWGLDGWILAEPLKKEWGDNEAGVFRCKYEYTDKLFSKYISKDARDD